MRLFAVVAAGALVLSASVQAATLTELDGAVSKYLADGKTDSAAALIGPAMAQARAEFSDSLKVAAYADSLAIRFFHAYDFTHGVPLFELGVTLRESVLPRDDLALAGPLQNLSTAYYIAGRYEESAAAQKRAVDINVAKLGPNHATTARSRLDLAIVDYAMARYGEAERELRAAITSLEPQRKTDPLPLAEAEQVLGEVCREMNRYGETEALMVDALDLARSALPERDPRLWAYLNSLAGFYKDQARYDETEPLLEEALDIVEAEPSLDSERATLTLNLAETYRLQGRYDDAIPLYQRAITAAEQTMPRLDVAVMRNQIASAYAEMDRVKDAEKQYREALAILETSSEPTPTLVAQSKNDLGVLLARHNRVPEGEKLLEEAIRLRESAYSKNHPSVGVSLTQLARARAGLFGSAAGKPTPRDRDAAALLDRALAIFDSTEAEPEGRVDAGIARAELFYRANDVNRAATTLAKALDDVEALRPHRGGGGAERMEFVRRYVDAYDEMTAWQVELGHASSALDYSERRRARVLVDRLTGVAGGTMDKESREALARLRADQAELEKKLGKLQSQAQALHAKSKLSKAERTQLSDIQKESDRIVAEIQRTNERVARLESSAASGGTRATRANPKAAQGEALLVYHIGGQASFLFVVEGSDVRALPLKVANAEAVRLGIAEGALTRDALAQLLTGYDTAGKPAGLGILRRLATPLESGASGDVAARARTSMYERLNALFVVLMPQWTTLRALREVTIIPDGSLSGFPFEACVVSLESGGDATFWLDDGPVVRYAPSIATLGALGTRTSTKAATHDVLSVCNPRYAAPLSPLPGSERETASVVSSFGKSRVTVLCGNDATEAAVRRAMSGKEIVHLATHGLVNQRQSDLLASLAFTPVASPQRDLRDDGFLQLFEIYDLPISAQLVVLSACESSAGNYVLGEGVMALSRGFLSAGARRVVATQWKVDDAATASLVGDFLGRVARAERSGGDLDFALALRDAKRAARQSAAWSQPFYWAAFVVTGAR